MKGIAVLAIAVCVLLSFRVAELERQRYLIVTGVCERNVVDPLPWIRCLATKQPRTSWWWNLYYGVIG